MNTRNFSFRNSVITISAGLAAALVAPLAQILLDPASYAAGAVAYMLTLTLTAVLIIVIMRLSRREFGLTLGRPVPAAVAILYPLAAAALIGGVAWVSSAATIDPDAYEHVLKNFLIMSSGTFVAAFLTEEGLFRGALWGAAERSGWNLAAILFWTTLAFVAWHAAIPFVDKNYAVPVNLLGYYFVNAALLGLSWGLIRHLSGSLLAPCLAHASWNGCVYVLFGYGDDKGALHIDNVAFYDPERGLLGVLLNTIVVILLAVWTIKRTMRHDV